MPTTLSFKSEVTLYENQIRCHINENEYNITQNYGFFKLSTWKGYYLKPYPCKVFQKVFERPRLSRPGRI